MPPGSCGLLVRRSPRPACGSPRPVGATPRRPPTWSGARGSWSARASAPGCARVGSSAAAATRAGRGALKALNAIGRAGIDDDGYRAGNATLRLEDMDRDGLRASVVYGPLSLGLPIHDPGAAECVLRSVERLGGRGVQRDRSGPAVCTRVPAVALARGRGGRAAPVRGDRSPRGDHRRLRDRRRRSGVGPAVVGRRGDRPADQHPHQGRHVVGTELPGRQVAVGGVRDRAAAPARRAPRDLPVRGCARAAPGAHARARRVGRRLAARTSSPAPTWSGAS